MKTFGKRSNKDRLMGYMQEVRRSERFRQTQGHDKLWGKLTDMYLGELDVANLGKDDDKIAVNMAFSTINVMFPSVSAGIPNIEVRANNPQNEQQAVLVEEVLNYTWRHHNFQPAFRAAAKDFLMFGHGWLKTSWSYVEEPRVRTDEELADEFETLRAQAEQAALLNPDLANSLPSDDDIANSLDVMHQVPVEDRPVVEHVSIRDMYVNPEATGMHDLRWIAQRLVLPISEVHNDDRYKASARKSLKGTYDKFRSDDPRSKGTHETDHDMVELWEFYDIAESTMGVFSLENGGTWLINPTAMPYVFGHPFVMMRNYDVPDHFYPIGDLEQLYPLQQELNKTRSDMLNYRASHAPKYLARASALQKGDHEKLSSRVPNEVILVENDQVPLDDVVVPLRMNNLDAGLFNWSQQISQDMNEVSGVSEYSRGGAGSIRRTATEAALIQDALNARSGEKLSLVEAAASQVARRVLQLMQMFTTGEQMARTFGPDGAQLWLPYTRDQIMGEYDFHVEAGSTTPNNETFRRQNVIALMNTMMPFLGTIIDPAELAMHALREGFSIRQPEKFLLQGPPPGADPNNPGTLPANGAAPPQGAGVDAPQQTPEERRDQEAQSAIQGIPAGLVNQLANQNGVSPSI